MAYHGPSCFWLPGARGKGSETGANGHRVCRAVAGRETSQDPGLTCPSVASVDSSDHRRPCSLKVSRAAINNLWSSFRCRGAREGPQPNAQTQLASKPPKVGVITAKQWYPSLLNLKRHRVGLNQRTRVRLHGENGASQWRVRSRRERKYRCSRAARYYGRCERCGNAAR